MDRSRDFLISIARRYYIDEKSQQEIAREFGLSRPTVSNILKKCKETGIVEIRVQDGSPRTTALGEEVRKRYGLSHVLVIPSTLDDMSVLSRVGNEAAKFTHSMLRSGLQIGVAWGTTLYQVVHQMPQEQQFEQVKVVQLMGGFGSSNPQYDGSELARELSKRVHGQYYPLQCPVLVQNIQVKELLIKEPWIAETLSRTQSLDLAIVGISSNDPETSALVRSGILSVEEATETQQAGAVGHICGYSYDAQGRMLDISLNQRIIGIAFSDFLRIPERIGVACGAVKAKAVQAALSGGHLTTLITDEVLASRLIQ
ncbi:MAG: sugar-binding transcriptional regulator [Spirochaetia bacterium]|nr:sugar-binding transcriptional regulator [Spirochaetia bacterium]